MAHERFSAYQRDVNRTMSPYQIENTANERLAAKIGKLPKRQAPAEVLIFVGVAAGTA
jgi:hypothetical protein